MCRFVLVVGVLLLSAGCVGMPGPESFDRAYSDKPKDNVKAMLGEPTSDKPVRAGQTREQLHAILGIPDMMSADKSTESYAFRRHRGYLFCIVPMTHFWGDQTKYDDFDLVLRFDSDERLCMWEFGESIVRFTDVQSDNRFHYKAGDTELFYVDWKNGLPTTQPR